MAKKSKKTQKTVVAKTATDLEAKVTAPAETSKDELVMEAKVQKKEDKKAEKAYSSTCVITNTSQNTICLYNGEASQSITVAPREIKQVSRDTLKALLKNEMVRRFFDKGILTSTMDADSVSAHDAVLPEELKNPVERHEDGQNVRAEVKKFEKDGTVHIDL